MTVFALLLPVYYNLVTAMVARREELVLKRLRTGEATGAEILAGTAAPAVTIAWAQVAVAAIAAAAVFGLDAPANVALILAAVVLGTAVFALLAAVSTAVTRTVELAQVTTLPVLLLPLVFSGLLFPLSGLREPLRSVAQALPLTPVVELMRLGLTGTAAGWSSPRPGGELRRGGRSGAGARGLDRGGRLGGATLVPLGTAALSKRDRLEG